LTILHYKGENIDQRPGQIIKVTVRNDLLEDFIKTYPNYIKQESEL
jgi:hypothetical protein